MTIQSDLYRCFREGQSKYRSQKDFANKYYYRILYKYVCHTANCTEEDIVSRGYQTYESVWNGWVKYGKEHERLRAREVDG